MALITTNVIKRSGNFHLLYVYKYFLSISKIYYAPLVVKLSVFKLAKRHRTGGKEGILPFSFSSILEYKNILALHI